MPLSPLTSRPSFEENPKLAKASHHLKTLLTAIQEKAVPDHVESRINEIVAGVSDFQGPDPQLLKQITAAQAAILKLLEIELGLVPKNHFQLQWLAIGMAAFGIPFGIVIGMALGNIAFLGIGLPIGIAIGISIGAGKDKEAAANGKQLDWSAK